MQRPATPPPAPATPDVCPLPGESAGAWAKRTLELHPRSETQAKILEDGAERLLLNCARQWGKSTLIAVKVLHLLLTRPGAAVSVVATRREQAALLCLKVTELAAKLNLKTKFAGKSHTLTLANGSSVRTLPHDADAVRGYAAHLLIFDEAAFVADEIYHAGIASVANTQGQLWFLSTPNAQQGLFYTLWHEKDSAWSRYLAPVTDYNYASEWLLSHEQRHNPRFRQEYYCEFQSPSGRLFSREVLDAAITTDFGPAIRLPRF